MFNKYSTFIVSIVIVLLFTIKPLDRTPLEQSHCYKNRIGEMVRAGRNQIDSWRHNQLVGQRFYPTISNANGSKGKEKAILRESMINVVKAVVFDNGISKNLLMCIPRSINCSS